MMTSRLRTTCHRYARSPSPRTEPSRLWSAHFNPTHTDRFLFVCLVFSDGTSFTPRSAAAKTSGRASLVVLRFKKPNDMGQRFTLCMRIAACSASE